MGAKSLISYGFLILPVAVTLGVLLGLQSYRVSRGFAPPFVSNKVTHKQYCQLSFGISPETSGQQYTLNPNQWGVTDATTSGGLCMNVTSFDNGSYPTRTSAPEWSITWQFPQGPPTQPVHAFPNIQIDPSNNVLPVEISTVAAINISTEWHYGVGSVVPTSTDGTELTSIELNANVAIDMFIDSNQHAATSTKDAKYEVMIWLADFGASTQPIGLEQGSRKTVVIGGTTFDLYFGVNGLQQTVLTWVASGMVQSISADFKPLLEDLTSVGGPSTTDYLGYLAFGSEALWSSQNVTFSNPTLNMDIVTR
ncbi:uncharacterized protein PV06_01020 [Exophiala oligosperma]|uniref:xyloglucan-specific endo-beta-1,4-glucanase n=2 Tax=Exophiala oligosperma TaxID=215243 RepID=A0A0D2CEZ6_9EURO|nr:uncharacterized protein PV06_01020 [Exophiala oligosperma]KIW48437.1 hypothetical protein PV06_01020 [Exophiala oligosperma]